MTSFHPAVPPSEVLAPARENTAAMDRTGLATNTAEPLPADEREALKPCPFCDRTDLLGFEPAERGFLGVRCRACGCHGPARRSEDEREASASWNARADRAASPSGAAEAKLWLWKNFVNGRPEYWAFDNPFPVHLDCGDPQTLGKPCGYALFKPSRVGRTDVPEAEVLRRVKASSSAAEPPAGFAMRAYIDRHDYGPDNPVKTALSTLATRREVFNRFSTKMHVSGVVLAGAAWEPQPYTGIDSYMNFTAFCLALNAIDGSRGSDAGASTVEQVAGSPTDGAGASEPDNAEVGAPAQPEGGQE